MATFREFTTKINALSVSKRVKFLPFFLLEIFKIALLSSIIPMLVVFVAIVLNIGFKVKMSIFFIIYVMTIIAVILSILMIFKKLPSENLVRILDNIEKGS